MKITKQDKPHIVAFSVFAAALLAWFIYAGSTGHRMFSNDDKKQEWNSSGPGNHK